jgi:leucyl/phenylalanyl-tRNA---protein transferase
MTQTIPLLSSDSLIFPPVNNALNDPNGLLAFGGDLTTKRLAQAYSLGIFPWFSEGDAIMWWSPDPRAIICCDTIKINKTLKKHLNKQIFSVTLNNAFDEVIEYCADAPFRKEGTWIVDEMIQAYKTMHQQGLAHSIEVWSGEELVGGLYGIAINGYFSGESMFYTHSNASKTALVYLVALLKSQKVEFLDCQMLNPFLADMGCVEVSREKFIEIKNQAIEKKLPKNFWHPRQLYLSYE